NASAGSNNSFINPNFIGTNYAASGSAGVGALVSGKFKVQQPLAGDSIFALNNADNSTACDLQTDSNRFLTFQCNGNGSLRFNIASFYSWSLTPGNYNTGGGMTIGGTPSTSMQNGGYGIQVAAAPTSGAKSAAQFVGHVATGGTAPALS